MNRNRFRMHPWLALVILSLAIDATATTWKEKVLYSFQGSPNDGFNVAGGVVFDRQGNLYGATTGGGTGCLPIGEECGLVFELSPPVKQGDPWTETIIFQFKGKGANDASAPSGGVILDSAGNVYGVTAYGGAGDCVLVGTKAGCGAVFGAFASSAQGRPLDGDDSTQFQEWQRRLLSLGQSDVRRPRQPVRSHSVRRRQGHHVQSLLSILRDSV